MSFKEIDEFKGNSDNTGKAGFNLEESKSFFITLCKGLSIPTGEYNPYGTIRLINNYIDKAPINRMLYSEISNYMFNIGSEELDFVRNNVETLLKEVTDAKHDELSGDCKKIVMKLYDHCNLAVNQTDNARQILESEKENVKKALDNDLKANFKSLEREYITILGIFVAIILAFVGGITFSSSVLQHMGSVSSYRLFAVIIALGDVMLNALFLMMKFICALNDRAFENKWIYWINGIAAFLFMLVVVMWYRGDAIFAVVIKWLSL